MFKYSKPIYHVSSLILFIIALFILPCFSFNCIHDKVDEQNRKHMNIRSVKYHDVKLQREQDPSSFETLHINFYIDNIDPSLSLDTIHNIELALDKAEEYIQNTFQVKKRKRPYVIERHSCISNWASGKNKGKCSKYTKDPEVCESKEINYVIPDKFLDKLEVFDFDGLQPKYAIASGPGLQRSNFITFITMQTEDICQEGAVAFGTYCRLDSKTSEPLAGILNLCPSSFSGKTKRLQYYYNVILHEMFHILGFSAKLLKKFLTCQKGTDCDMPKNVIQEDKSGIPRMMFPLVIESMQNHFGCSMSNFGGPMALKEQNESLGTVPYTSHWHPVLMYSSIMTPSYSESEEVFVDNVTLALFASTGWYRVNFSSAENFKFGLGEGCDFGMDGSCDNSTYLCNPSYENYGCDLLHKTIGKCENLTSTHPCGVYLPYTRRDCETILASHLDLDYKSLDYQHKCFMFQKSESEYEPSCLPIKCKSEYKYDILINMTWYPCHKQQVTGQNFSLLCPESVYFCSKALPSPPAELCPSDTQFFIAVRMYFEQPRFEELLKEHNFKNFKVTALKAIAAQIEIPVNYIVNSTLSVFKQIYLDFSICPPPDFSSSDLNAILMRVQKFLDGNFMYILKGPPDKLISSNDINIDPVDVMKFSDHDGFRSLLAFPVICAIFLIATFLASICRLHLLQKHRPRRAVENPDNIELSDVNSS